MVSGTQIKLVLGILFTVLGLVFAACGYSLYREVYLGDNELAGDSARFPEKTNRIVFWASEKVPRDANHVHLIHTMVTDLDRAQKSAKVYLELNFSPNWLSSETGLVMIVRIPHKVSSMQCNITRYLKEGDSSKKIEFILRSTIVVKKMYPSFKARF